MKLTKQYTSRENQSTDIYLKEISRTAPLSVADEVDCAKRIKKNDKRALEKLVKANLRFVVTVAKQYQNQGLSLNDLINEGNVGLIKAAKKFDHTRGFKFISYAVWWIKQSILQALAEQSRVVRLPLNIVQQKSKITKIMSELEQKNERVPNVLEIAEQLDMSVYEVQETLKNSGGHVSMDAPSIHGEDTKLIDIMPDKQEKQPDTKLLADSLKIEIERALDTLSQREKEVVKLYFGLSRENPLTLEEIGDMYSLTRERVRQIKEKAIRRLRQASRSKSLKSYLG
ncbi:sigma-70 family RNA polymerase sigma factor [soil metagenome]